MNINKCKRKDGKMDEGIPNAPDYSLLAVFAVWRMNVLKRDVTEPPLWCRASAHSVHAKWIKSIFAKK